eukprot:5746745-Prorocentrum_lima.AAC.1
MLPEGVPYEKMWVVSPPCARLQEVALAIRLNNMGSEEIMIEPEQMAFYQQRVAEMAEKSHRTAQAMGIEPRPNSGTP